MNTVRNVLGFTWLTLAWVGPGVIAAGPSDAKPLASIRLYNPTRWEGSLPVEVPVGRLATPGLIDWANVHLATADGRSLPFAIREGRPHWKSRLPAPLGTPRAEDLVIFSCAVMPNRWARIDLLPGPQSSSSTVASTSGKWVVSYPNLQATVDRSTGMLLQLEVFGQRLLDNPLAISFWKLTEEKGRRQPLGTAKVRLASQSSNAAMTELDFVLESEGLLALAVSYRIHACGVVEIWSDERPWQGRSPWVDHAVSIAFPLGGQPEVLPLLVNRAPFYGFKDFAEVVKHAAVLRRYPQASLLELGEETTNGRRWNRRLYPLSPQKAAHAEDLVALADQGLVVETLPKTAPLPAGEVRIAYPQGNHVPAETLAESLKKRGMAATRVEAGKDSPDAAVRLTLVAPKEAPGIEGDGFEVRWQPDPKGLVVAACTRLGLMQGVLRIADYVKNRSGEVCVPLVAGNPAVALRAGGFGGGDFEVDFPYGSEAEWQAAFDPMIASGMNVMADLGMWGNWKMPISYREMPELRSDSPDAYDEVSGARFAEFATHHERGLRLLSYLHDRGVKVWLWLPVGCVPTTYAQKHPEAMAPKNDHCPCFTHPLYARYLAAFLTELLATYPIDGIVMIRDDNGGLCPCERCKAYVEASPTKSAAWEQYLILYRWLKKAGFQGEIAVYPYFDLYQPRLDPLLPSDLQIVGHGSAAAVLARDYERLALMGDTWLDNLFGGFRVPTTARMRRLLADRNGFWIGGAFCGCELPWESVGRFGWEPTATVNTLRYEQGLAQFGRDRAAAFVELAVAYEQLWEIYDLPMLPQEWMKLEDARRRDTATQGRKSLQLFRQRLTALRQSAGSSQDAWFRHVDLFATYFEYHLRRLELFARMHAIAVAHKDALAKPEGLPRELREELIAAHREIYAMAERLDQQAAGVPGSMIARTRANQMTRPFKEWVNGYDASLEYSLTVRQFAGTVEVRPTELKAGEPFVLRVRLQNTGVCPWMPGVGHRLEFGGDVARLGLPKQWEYEGSWMAFGDRREVELRGVTPKEPGEGKYHLTFFGPFRNRQVVMEKDVALRWK